MAKSKTRHYNLYLKWPRDREIIDWLDEQENASRAIRERLSRTFSEQQPGGNGAIDAMAVQEAVARALDDRHLTLGDLRRVVEAALKGALSGLTVAGGSDNGGEEPDSWLEDIDEMIID